MAICEVCEAQEATDIDHALFPSPRWSKKIRPEMASWREEKYNLRKACPGCNRWERKADTEESRVKHVRNWLAKDREGFIDWLARYPGKVVPGSRISEIYRHIT